MGDQAIQHQGRWLKDQIARTGKTIGEFAAEVRVSREGLQRMFNSPVLRWRPCNMYRILGALGLTDLAPQFQSLPTTNHQPPTLSKEI